MRGLAGAFVAVLIGALLAAPAAPADPGFSEVDAEFIDEDGSPAIQAGSHPFAMRTKLAVNTLLDGEGDRLPDGALKDLTIQLPAGIVGDREAVPQCPAVEFDVGKLRPACPDASAIGHITVELSHDPIAPGSESYLDAAIYNLVPPPGVAARIGFLALGLPVTLSVTVNPEPPFNLIARSANTSQGALFYSADTIVWGNPSDPVHNPLRGSCLDVLDPKLEPKSLGSCSVTLPERPFLTLPRSCEGPLETAFHGTYWNSGVEARAKALSEPMVGCEKLRFGPQIAAKPTSDQASSPSGLDFNLDVDDEGLTSAEGLAESDIEKAVVTLPEGMTVNPSVAAGLLACSPAQYAAERVGSGPDEGCPQASKVGTVEVETPLLEGELLKGSVFVASQGDNPFGSLIALYMVIKHPGLGIMVKLPGRVEPDLRTGQLVTTFGEPPYEVPQFPFSHFRFHFREGGRSPLITPDRCGDYETGTLFTPWANPATALPITASFKIARGLGGGPCPPAGPLPFAPGLIAGTLNNQASAYSPFYMQLTRRDGDQDMTRFSAVLPPGVVGKLAGLGKCPEGAIALARAKSGRQELADPSCPASSLIGRTEAGAGVGSQLTYVPGSLYLAGPYRGAPLSVIAITPAVAGPFDAGTVAVRVALTLNPVTAQVEADGARSDPIPHILQGIPLKVRDLRVHVDRPRFILNPSGCKPSQTRAALFGSFLDLFDPADDIAVSLKARFQAANCARLRFKPRLAFSLKGGTERGANPAFRALLRPRPGDANIKRMVVRFPRSAFLDQGHIRTICTRVQFAADSCPKGSVYGQAIAHTPLLEEPLKGPVYLRSSSNELPDLVFDLHGVVDIEAAARVDSTEGRLRVTFPAIPDAPVSKVLVRMQGGEKGLIVNSRDLCAAPSTARVQIVAHNAARRGLRPVLRARCGERR
jgi:hypothetical protein